MTDSACTKDHELWPHSGFHNAADTFSSPYELGIDQIWSDGELVGGLVAGDMQQCTYCSSISDDCSLSYKHRQECHGSHGQ